MADTERVEREYPSFLDYFYHLQELRNKSRGAFGIGEAIEKQYNNVNDFFNEYKQKLNQTYGRWYTDQEANDTLPKPFIVTYVSSKENIFQRIGRDFGSFGKEIGGLVQKLAAKVGQVASILPLAPFKRAMKKYLDNRKISYKGNNLLDISAKFYEKAVLKKFDGVEPMTTATVISMVASIIAVFNAMKEKPADKEEEELVNIANQDSAKADQLIKQEEARIASEYSKDRQGGSMSNSLSLLILILVIIGGGYYVLRTRRN